MLSSLILSLRPPPIHASSKTVSNAFDKLGLFPGSGIRNLRLVDLTVRDAKLGALFRRLSATEKGRKRPSLPLSRNGALLARDVPKVLARFSASDQQEWTDVSLKGLKKLELTADGDIKKISAGERIDKGTNIFTLNQGEWVSLETVAGSQIGPLVHRLEPWMQLALFLMSEKSSQGSPWQRYLSQLPGKPYSPSSWSEEELNAIQGTQLHESAVGYREFFRQKFVTLQADLFEKHPETFDRSAFDFGSFLWAVGTVRSQIRSPMDGDGVALVPTVSSIAHSRDGNVEVIYDSGSLFKPTATLTVRATRQIQPGDSLKMDYGSQKSDSQIALDYGVVDEANLKGGYSLSLQLPETDAFRDDKLDILEICGLNESASFDFLPDQDPSADLLLFLRLLNISGPDAFHLEALFRNEIQDHLENPLSLENEGCVCDSMIGGCRDALKAYQSLDFAALPLSKQSLARQVCAGEQKTLEWMLLWFQQRKQSLNEMEYYAERRLKRLGLLDDEGKSTFEDMWKDGIA